MSKQQDFRKAGMMLLMSHFSSDDSSTLEDIVFKKSKDQKMYKKILTDIHSYVTVNNKTHAELIDILNSEKYMWNHPILDDILTTQNEIFSYIENPFEIVDGLFKCQKCGNGKTVSYSKQTRSSDEGMSTFVFCTNRECLHHWMYKG
jgi:DNA-directed RNA polymerase subunit M/transcription elongation factor TFIIS